MHFEEDTKLTQSFLTQTSNSLNVVAALAHACTTLCNK